MKVYINLRRKQPHELRPGGSQMLKNRRPEQ